METRREALCFRGGALETLGWSVLYGVLLMLVFPAAWGAAGLTRWWTKRTEVEGGGRLAFLGRGAEVWGLFVAMVVLASLPQLVRVLSRDDPRSLGLTLVAELVLLPFVAAVKLPLYRWLVENLRLEPGGRLRFSAPYVTYLGWLFLLFASFFTVVGWAWVAVALLRWLCGQIRGEACGVAFVGTGWGLLWRCVVWLAGGLLLLPLPWVLRSIYAWFTNNLQLVWEAPDVP